MMEVEAVGEDEEVARDGGSTLPWRLDVLGTTSLDVDYDMSSISLSYIM